LNMIHRFFHLSCPSLNLRNDASGLMIPSLGLTGRFSDNKGAVFDAIGRVLSRLSDALNLFGDAFDEALHASSPKCPAS
jgi:hypothetical protein